VEDWTVLISRRRPVAGFGVAWASMAARSGDHYMKCVYVAFK